MPIGVPKVEYRLPGEPEADWIDLYNCLYRERMLFLCQDLGDEVANQLISLMLYLNAEDPSQPFFMYINSLGGSVTCGIGVYDIMPHQWHHLFSQVGRMVVVYLYPTVGS